jgi:hypothetical protein
MEEAELGLPYRVIPPPLVPENFPPRNDPFDPLSGGDDDKSDPFDELESEGEEEAGGME